MGHGFSFFFSLVFFDFLFGYYCAIMIVLKMAWLNSYFMLDISCSIGEISKKIVLRYVFFY